VDDDIIFSPLPSISDANRAYTQVKVTYQAKFDVGKFDVYDFLVLASQWTDGQKLANCIIMTTLSGVGRGY